METPFKVDYRKGIYLALDITLHHKFKNVSHEKAYGKGMKF